MQLAFNRKWAIALGALFVIPTAYFILISILNDWGLPYLSEASQPFLQKLGIKDPPGFNINLLILIGPLIALALNLFVVLKIEWHNWREDFSINISIHKHWMNMLLIIIAGILLAVLFFYAIGENCNCF